MKEAKNFNREDSGKDDMTALPQPCLVIGARGMLGTDLVDLLHQSGAEVIAPSHHELDICDPDSVRIAFETYKPGLVLNVAALTDVDGCEVRLEEAFRVNARGPELLAREAGRQGSFLVHISTDYVFDGSKGSPYREEDPMTPQGVYARSKAEGERRIRELLPDAHGIVRTQWLFGLHGKNFVEAILALAARQDRLTVVNDQHGSPTYTNDLAEALLLLCRRGFRGTVHVTSSGHTTWFDFAVEILRREGLEHVRVDPITSEALARPAPRPRYAVLEPTRFVALTGAPLRAWQDALGDYLRSRAAQAAAVLDGVMPIRVQPA